MKDDGGPAFPALEGGSAEDTSLNGYYTLSFESASGMSLRDYFAGQAIHAAESVIVYYSDKSRNEPMHIAVLAYEIADALLKERAKP